ncbi:MAG: hypothetical protein JWQ25_1761 [Daejeonella sp.]|nr:hypothetical protein [Daejeonella sp.]
MKKVIAIALLFSVIGTSCKKEEGAKPELKKESGIVNTKPKDTQSWD